MLIALIGIGKIANYQMQAVTHTPGIKLVDAHDLDSNKAEDAAVALKITAADLKALKVIDEIIPEPVGGAHRDPEHMMAKTGEAIAVGLASLKDLGPDETRRQRRDKFLAIGRSL